MPLDPLDFASQPPMSIYNTVSLLELCSLAQRFLMLAFVHYRRVTSTNFLLHPYLRYPHSILASLLIMLLIVLNNLSYFTDELDQSLPSACHSPWNYAQVPYNRLIFLDYLLVFSSSNNLLALNSLSV
jgi:hypothetical protein